LLLPYWKAKPLGTLIRPAGIHRKAQASAQSHDRSLRSGDRHRAGLLPSAGDDAGDPIGVGPPDTQVTPALTSDTAAPPERPEDSEAPAKPHRAKTPETGTSPSEDAAAGDHADGGPKVEKAGPASTPGAEESPERPKGSETPAKPRRKKTPKTGTSPREDEAAGDHVAGGPKDEKSRPAPKPGAEESLEQVKGSKTPVERRRRKKAHAQAERKEAAAAKLERKKAKAKRRQKAAAKPSKKKVPAKLRRKKAKAQSRRGKATKKQGQKRKNRK